MEFTHIDFHDPLWNKFIEYYEARLILHHKTLEQPNLTETETAVLRGQIKEIRSFLGLNKPPPRVQPMPPSPTGEQ